MNIRSTAVTPGQPGPVLLSLASRQVWPHVLAVAHLKPKRLILLHSDDLEESEKPARRLKRFFDQRSRLIAPGKSKLEIIPHDDFTAVRQRLDELAQRLDLASHCILNFTGGNKLMATAAFLWAAERHIKSFYLERGNQLTWFEPSEDGFTTHSETLSGHISDSFDPVSLLRCQLSTSEVYREGERLILSKAGRELSEDAFYKQVEQRRSVNLMEKSGTGDKESKRGDKLELDAAALLLKLGVKEVRRSLQLKVNVPGGVSSRLPHAEFDLLFNWNGKLWLVDCKDRKPEENLVEGLRRELRPHKLSQGAESLLKRIGKELSISPTKVLKEDLVAISDIGGLLGQIVCVRKTSPREEVHAYARRNRIEVILKEDMFEEFRRLLEPERKPSAEQLVALEQQYSR